MSQAMESSKSQRGALSGRHLRMISSANSGRPFFLILSACLFVLLLSVTETRAESVGGSVLLLWDSESKATNVAAAQSAVHFVFSFTNVSSGDVTIFNVKPSCGCTTAQLPKLPWVVASGANGQIGVTVNLLGKSGTLIKTVKVSTDKSADSLMVRITIVPLPGMSEMQREQNMKIAATDRQAVFKGDCASCHATPAEGKSGKALYDIVCGICHDGPSRATMVPDLHKIKQPGNVEFWKDWIEHGKPGTLMPAFSKQEGGPLSDAQIDSLLHYLMAVTPPSGATVLKRAP